MMKKKKEYLLRIERRDSDLMIVANSDWGVRPFGVRYCGRDTGKRYTSIGYAERYLKRIADMWETLSPYAPVVGHIGTARQIPVFGSDPDSVRRDFM